MDNHTPTLTVKLAGSTAIPTDNKGTLETRGGQGILSISVYMRLDNPDMFSVEYDMMKLEGIQLLDSFKPGDLVEISMGLEEQKVLCRGEISYIEPNFDIEAGYRTTISGYHKLHRLTRGQRSKTWGDGLEASQVPTTAVSDVINNSKAHEGGKTSDKMSAGKLAPTDLKLKYIPQLNMSDFEFLRAIGANLEFKAETGDEPDKVELIKADPSSQPVITLARERANADGENSLILHASFRLSTVQQYSAVEVRGWDPVTKKNIVQKVTSSSYVFDGTKGHEDTAKGLYGTASSGRKYVVVDQPIGSVEEAKSLAQSLFDQFSMDFLTGECVMKGNPVIIPGATIAFNGFGKAFDGKYLITAATHTFRPEEGYRTTASFARNSKGAAS